MKDRSREQKNRFCADPAAKLRSPIEPRFGADPRAKVVTLALPDALVMDRIVEVWHKVRKHSIIVLVFDKSGSMGGSKIGAALAEAKEFINLMDREDSLAWMPFDDRVYSGVLGPKSEFGEKLLGDISSTTAGGGTALYDAIFAAHDLLEGLRPTYRDTVRYGIVVLADGKDTNSRRSLAQLEQKLSPSEIDPPACRSIPLLSATMPTRQC